MTRLEKAYQEYPDGVVYEINNKQVKIHDCCPAFIDIAEEHVDPFSLICKHGDIEGCREITCEQCWNKEYFPVKG